MSLTNELDVGSEVIVCGGSYPGACGTIVRKTAKRFDIRRTDGSVIQVAQHNVRRANKTPGTSWRSDSLEDRVERQMERVTQEVEELRRLMGEMKIQKRSSRN